MESVLQAIDKWVTEKDAYYLAKEDQVVWYASDTGGKTDYKWHRMTLTEVRRVITVTMLSSKTVWSTELIVQIFQERMGVFEYAISSTRKTRPGVFNYLKQGGIRMEDTVYNMLATELLQRGYTALLYSDITNMANRTLTLLGTGVSPAEHSRLMFKHMPDNGFIVRTEHQRPTYKGKKVSAVMLPNTAPKEICQISYDEAKAIANKLYGALK